MRRISILLIAVALVASCPPRSDAGLIINLFNNGGTAPGNTAGSGTLFSVMRAAADVWELAFSAENFYHPLDLYYGWGAQDNGTLAAHGLFNQGGNPNRETLGLITFDNDESSVFFLDGTLDTENLEQLIASSSEFTSGLQTSSIDLGGGSMNKKRSFSGAMGDAAGRHDAFTIALHEIGHALGMSTGNLSYQLESWPDNDIDITGSLPFAGSAIPTNNSAIPVTNTMESNAHIRNASGTGLNTTLLYSSIGTGTRKLPTYVDILANAQLSQFTNPNLDLASVPEPSGLLLAGIVGGMGLVFRGRRRRGDNKSQATTA